LKNELTIRIIMTQVIIIMTQVLIIMTKVIIATTNRKKMAKKFPAEPTDNSIIYLAIVTNCKYSSKCTYVM